MANEKHFRDIPKMVRLIDANALDTVPWEDQWDAMKAINNAPTVDAVPVVRCKDCKYYHTHNRSVKWNTEAVYCCKSALKKVCPDDFCSYGERKD